MFALGVGVKLLLCEFNLATLRPAKEVHPKNLQQMSVELRSLLETQPSNIIVHFYLSELQQQQQQGPVWSAAVAPKLRCEAPLWKHGGVFRAEEEETGEGDKVLYLAVKGSPRGAENV